MAGAVRVMGSPASIGNDRISKVAPMLGGSEMVVRLIDARMLTDKKALERAVEWLGPDTGLTIIFLAFKPLSKRGGQGARRRRIATMIHKLRG